MKTKREEKLENELQRTREALKTCRKALHQKEQKISDLEKSRNLHKSKSKELSEKLKAECVKKKRGLGDYSQQLIERHGYTDMIVSLCVEMYVHCRCGLRTTRAMLVYLNERLKWDLPSIPCHNSIKNWVEKSGYAVYHEPEMEEYEDGYAVIVDESMMIAGEKMLLTLGIPAKKTGDKALTFNDINVLDIGVKIGRTGNVQISL
jgi:hypothetical protein